MSNQDHIENGNQRSQLLQHLIPNNSLREKLGVGLYTGAVMLGLAACQEAAPVAQTNIEQTTTDPATNYETPTPEATKAPAAPEYLITFANTEASLTTGQKQFVEQFKSVDDLQSQDIDTRVAWRYILFGDSIKEFAKEYASISGNPKDQYPETITENNTPDEISSIILNGFRYAKATEKKVNDEYVVDGKYDSSLGTEFAASLYFMPLASQDYKGLQKRLVDYENSSYLVEDPARAFKIGDYPIDNPDLKTVFGDLDHSAISGDSSGKSYAWRNVTQTVISSGQVIESYVIFIPEQDKTFTDGSTEHIAATWVIQNGWDGSTH